MNKLFVMAASASGFLLTVLVYTAFATDMLTSSTCVQGGGQVCTCSNTFCFTCDCVREMTGTCDAGSAHLTPRAKGSVYANDCFSPVSLYAQAHGQYDSPYGGLIDA